MVQMATNNNKPDRATIVFGPTKNNTTKSITQKQKQQLTDTQEATVQNIINNPTLNFGDGGGGVATQGTVTTFSQVTNTGTATLVTGPLVTFINGTGVNLVAGDVVALLVDTAGTYVAIAIISRAGAISPIVIAGITIGAGYPKQTDASVLTYPIQGIVSNGIDGIDSVSQIFTIDTTGNFGNNTNAIYGYNGEFGSSGTTSTVNGINTVAGTNLSLGLVPNFNYASSLRYLFVNPSGIMFAWDRTNSTHNMSYRNTSAGAFTSIMTTNYLTSSLSVAYDDSNGSFWFENVNNTFNKWFDGDSTSATVTLTGNTAVTRLVAGNGYLFGIAGTTLYRKLSNNTTDWTSIYTGVITFGQQYAAGPDGKLYILFESGTPNIVKIERYGPSGVELCNTGIDGSLGSGNVRGMGLAVSSSNVPYFTLVQRADLLSPAGTSSQYGIGLYAANFTTNSTSFLYADSSMYQAVNVTFVEASSLQIKDNVAYWIHGNQGDGLTTKYQIYSGNV
jgi:hypothetical protein